MKSIIDRIRILYLKLNSVRIFILEKSRSFFNFFCPNVYKITIGRVISKSTPKAYQKVLCEGKGIVEIGDTCSFGYKLGGFNRGGYIELQARYPNAVIKIGDNVSSNNNIFICSANHVEVGDNTLIGQYVTIMDFEAHGIDPNKRRQLGEIGKIRIGKNVWIGNNVTILKNTFIGDNSVVAAGAVVSGVFPSDVVIGGIPAKIIKYI